jgi:hypothetical protein
MVRNNACFKRFVGIGLRDDKIMVFTFFERRKIYK